MAKRRNYRDLGVVGLPEKDDRRITAMIEEAERELEETRVSFRWGKEQLSVVKEAAEQMGVPYQTFTKMSVYQRALDVLKDVHESKSPGRSDSKVASKSRSGSKSKRAAKPKSAA